MEMALEAYGQLPVTVSSVDFKSMLRIPRIAQGEPSAVVSLRLDTSGQDKGMTHFNISSAPARGQYAFDVPVQLNECCSGIMVDSMLLDDKGHIKEGFILGEEGLVSGLRLRDLGKEGLAELMERHNVCYAKNTDQFYAIIMDEVSLPQEGFAVCMYLDLYLVDAWEQS